jgi:hypothetical protein
MARPPLVRVALVVRAAAYTLLAATATVLPARPW